MGCHGPTGSGMQAIGSPRIAGQNPWYIQRQIQNFKAGVRGATPGDTHGIQMPPIVAILITQQDSYNVVAYVGTLKPEILPHTVKGGDPAKGKEIFKTCAACHGEDGKGIELLSSPRVAGIPDYYLLRQINNFKKGVRGKHEDDIFGRQMALLQELSLKDDQAILDVIAYINSLPPE
jgi:cytochrome c oxidase subunit 2